MIVGYAAFQTNLNITAKGNIKDKEHIIMGGLKVYTTRENDGLYKDIYEEGKYIYKGGNPNNYITFNNEMWRILSIENNGTLKIIRMNSIGDKSFDSLGLRTTGYCSQSAALDYGCNVWMAIDNFVIGNTSGVVNKDAELNTYLNTTYYNGLNSEARGKIVVGTFMVGPVIPENADTLISTINQEKKYQWNGKIALLTVSEYIKASNNMACTNVFSYTNSGDCYSNSNTHNWLFNIVTTTTISRMRLLSPFIDGDSADIVFDVTPNGTLSGHAARFDNYGVVPVLYLTSEIILSGEGTIDNPYKIN